MPSAEIFLDIFTDIEKYLRKQSGSDTSKSFTSIVSDLSYNNRLIKYYSQALKDFADLRNAIIHSPRSGGKPIADPREDVISEIRLVAQKIINPVLVDNVGFIHDVYTTTKETPISEVLKAMVLNDYSQAPILENGKTAGLLTKEGIATWLGQLAIKDDTIICTKETTVGNLTPHINTIDNYKLISRKTNIVEARDYFIEALGKPVPLEALLVTDNGRATEGLLGIITRSEDLSVIVKNL